MVGLEYLFGPLPGDRLDKVCNLLSLVIPLAGVSFGVFVGQATAAGQHYRLGDVVFGWDESHAGALTRAFLPYKFIYLRVILLKCRKHIVFSIKLV